MKIIPWDEFRRQQRGEYQLTITPDQLRLGDFVCQIDALVPPLDFPRGGVRVESFADKEWFKQRCRRVVVDLEHCLNRRVEGVNAALSVGVLPELPASIDALRNNGISARRLVDAWSVYRRLSLISQAQILSFHRHGQIDVTDANDAIDELVDAVPQHLAALIWLTHIKEPSRYAFQHGLNTAILAACFSHAAGWERGVSRALALSALVHDLGMMRISLKVLRKPGALSTAEREHVQLHTRLGHELLSQNDGLPDIASTVALCHHERPDGQGYPEGLTQRGIPAMARLVAVISAYEAMTTRRVHQKALSHQQAMGELWKLKGKQFDENYAEAFSKFLGWAPPGVMLRLPDGDLAAAVHAINGAPRPIVQLVRRRGEKLELGAMIDLGSSAHRAKDRAVLIADGQAGISHRALTREMPGALRSARVTSASLSQPDDEQPMKERRKRPRINAPRGTRILIIDDSNTVRLALTTMLGENHYRLSEAASAKEGLEIAVDQRPQLIFLDIILPDMSGFRALRKIRSTEETRAIPVIMMSGNDGATEKFFLKRVGADDFIHKPFGRFEVFGAIERLIRAGALNARVGD
jgi:response regulator RpfG family c-di-GMP phosphodiesterase